MFIRILFIIGRTTKGAPDQVKSNKLFTMKQLKVGLYKKKNIYIILRVISWLYRRLMYLLSTYRHYNRINIIINIILLCILSSLLKVKH